MGVIEDEYEELDPAVVKAEYEELDADVSLAEFAGRVEEKVDEMGGLVDDEAAAALVAEDIDGGIAETVAEIEPDVEEVKFTAKVVRIGETRTFERDDGEDGTVANVEVADETGAVRVAFWDEMAEGVTKDMEEGQVLRIKGRPKEGYDGIEVSADRAEPADEDISVDLGDTYRVEDLSLGRSNVNLRGKVLATDSVRTFDRDDGSEGRVANLTVGDPTGRLRVTLWDDMADYAEKLEPDVSIEIVDGYVRERDGSLELHVGDRSAIETIDETIGYSPEGTPIEELSVDDTVDVVGVVRSADTKRTFERDDGSEGQVRNVRIQDKTGDIRAALWGEKADIDIGPGDEIAVADAEIEDGFQDDMEASVGWRSSVTVLDETPTGTDASDTNDTGGTDASDTDDAGGDLSAFADDAGSEDEATGDDGDVADDEADTGPSPGESVEFTGVVVQTEDPVILDNGEATLSVTTDVDVVRGREVTVRGTYDEDGERVVAEDIV
ncbi:replication factor A [Halobacteriales archaeon SW_7_68_16]|nr:MAG: replication factor A [Halobacteriales archaeon SW_7_68_16]